MSGWPAEKKIFGTCIFLDFSKKNRKVGFGDPNACEPCHCLAHLLACEMCVCVLFVRGVVQGHEEMSLSGWPAAASALARAAKKNFWDLYFLGIF